MEHLCFISVFQVALFQLPDVTLMVSVYNKRSMKRKEMIGWFSLGMLCHASPINIYTLVHVYVLIGETLKPYPGDQS